MEKISSKKIENIRKNKGYSSKSIFYRNFCQFLKEKENYHENQLPTKKTIERIEFNNEISKKYLELICKFLVIKPEDIQQGEKETYEGGFTDEDIERFKQIDTGLKRVRLITENDLRSLSSFKKNIFLTKPVQASLLETRHEEIWKCLSEILKSSSPYNIMKNHGSDPSYEITRTNLFTKLHNLIDSTPCKLYATSFTYCTFWPFPSFTYDIYMEQKDEEDGKICMSDIYIPQSSSDKSFNGSWHILPVEMHYQVFILCDMEVESIRFDDDAGKTILDQAVGRMDVSEENMSEDAYEDHIHNGPLFGRRLYGTYEHVLEEINNTYMFTNYIDSTNIEVIFKPKTLFQPKPFNINDYRDDELDFIDRVLKNKNFHQYFAPNKLENFHDINNKNYHTRLDFLERSNLKKKFFDGVSSLYTNKSWARIDTDEKLLEGILDGSANEIHEHISFKIDDARMDAYEDEKNYDEDE